jgi:copper homeostasis protein
VFGTRRVAGIDRIVEAVCCSVQDALVAQECGADRIELVSAIEIGGLTPSIGAVEEVLAMCRLPVMAMVRPRAGGFVYSEHELRTMERDIRAFGNAGVHGVVFGVLKPDDTIDGEACRRLLAASEGMQTVCHRAFDRTPDAAQALAILKGLRFTRVLTTGQTGDAITGSATIRRLVGRGVEVLACGNIRPENVRQVVESTGVDQIHLGPMKREGTSESFFGEGYDSLDGTVLREVVRQLSREPGLTKA